MCIRDRIVSINTSSQGEPGQRERVAGAMAHLRNLRKGNTLGTSLAEAIEDGRD